MPFLRILPDAASWISGPQPTQQPGSGWRILENVWRCTTQTAPPTAWHVAPPVEAPVQGQRIFELHTGSRNDQATKMLIKAVDTKLHCISASKELNVKDFWQKRAPWPALIHWVQTKHLPPLYRPRGTGGLGYLVCICVSAL